MTTQIRAKPWGQYIEALHRVLGVLEDDVEYVREFAPYVPEAMFSSNEWELIVLDLLGEIRSFGDEAFKEASDVVAVWRKGHVDGLIRQLEMSLREELSSLRQGAETAEVADEWLRRR